MQIPSAPNTEHKCHHRSSSFSHLAAWPLAANMEQIQILETSFEDFSFYICKRETWPLQKQHRVKPKSRTALVIEDSKRPFQLFCPTIYYLCPV